MDILSKTKELLESSCVEIIIALVYICHTFKNQYEQLGNYIY